MPSANYRKLAEYPVELTYFVPSGAAKEASGTFKGAAGAQQFCGCITRDRAFRELSTLRGARRAYTLEGHCQLRWPHASASFQYSTSGNQHRYHMTEMGGHYRFLTLVRLAPPSDLRISRGPWRLSAALVRPLQRNRVPDLVSRVNPFLLNVAEAYCPLMGRAQRT